MSKPTNNEGNQDIVNGINDYKFDENTMSQLYDDVDPDLAWIIDAAEESSTNTCDHSDHEHMIQPSSTSESSEDMICIHETTSSLENTIQTGESFGAKAPSSYNGKKVPPHSQTKMSTEEYHAKRNLPEDGKSDRPMSVPASTRGETNPRMRKINGDDTILNLFAVTVAKAISSPNRRQTPDSIRSPSNRSMGIKPDITSPASRVGNIKPDVTSPRKNTVIKVEKGSDGVAASASATKATGPPCLPQRQRSTRIKPEISSPQRTKPPVKSEKEMMVAKAASLPYQNSKTAPIFISPAKAKTLATGVGVKQLAEHFEPIEQKGVHETDRVKSINEYNESTSFINASPTSQVAHQQILQLEIAKELDSGNNSRRFQLAIQSHVSSLTLGTTYTDFDETTIGNGHDDDESTVGNNYSIIPDYSNDEEIAKIVQSQKQKLSTADNDYDNDSDGNDSNDNTIEIILGDIAPTSTEPLPKEPASMQSTLSAPQDIQITLSSDGKLVKVLPPALLLQKSHSWVRKKLWGQTVETPQFAEQRRQQDQRNITCIEVNQEAQTSQDLYHPQAPELSTSLVGQQEKPDEVAENACMEGISLPNPNIVASSSQQHPPSSNVTPEVTQLDHETWKAQLVYFCVAFVVPFTYRAGSTLPQIFVLIELVDVYEISLYLVGTYLSITLMLRYTMRYLCTHYPRVATLGGTTTSLLGYLILLLIDMKSDIQLKSDGIQSFLFVISMVVIGLNEIYNGLRIVVEDNFGCFDPSAPQETLLTRCLGVQYSVIQFSTIIAYALGGIVYEHFGVAGAARFGAILLAFQLISLLTVFALEHKVLLADSASQEFLEEVQRSFSLGQNLSSTGSEVDANQDYSNSTKEYSLYNCNQDIGTSFRSLVTPELETIDEVNNAGSDLDEEPSLNFRIGYYDSEVSDHQQSVERSLASSSETPEHDNRSSSRISKSGKTIKGLNIKQQESATHQAQHDDELQIFEWQDVYLILGNIIYPVLNGLVFGVGTLLLHQDFNLDKDIIGFIYAASSICAGLPYFIQKNHSNPRQKETFQLSEKYYLVGLTYMILLTAIAFLSTYIVGVLLMSFFLGSFVTSLNEIQCQQLHLNNKLHKRMQAYRQWGSFFSCLFVTFVTPILYNILPRLPNMVGTGICCVFTMIVWVESIMRSLSTSNKKTDEAFSNNIVNTTAETVPSLDTINVLALAQEELDRRKERLVTATLMHVTYLDSLVERSL